MRKTITTLAVLVTVSLSTISVQAQSIQSELHKHLDETLGRAVQLAEVFPDSLYDWSPTDVVRSFGAQAVHTAVAAYFFGSRVGIDMPEDVDLQQSEAMITSKEDVIAFLQAAKDHVVPAIADVSDEALAAEATFPDGSPIGSGQEALLVFLRHNSEHLGQLIVYARLNDIAPPWSQ